MLLKRKLKGHEIPILGTTSKVVLIGGSATIHSFQDIAKIRS